MPQCKRDGCREPAVGFDVKTEGFKRKQYCAEHYEAYKAKQREHRAKSAHLPDCSRCGANKVLRDDHLCRSCRDRHDNEERKLAIWRALDNCETVDDLKDWISTHVKPRG